MDQTPKCKRLQATYKDEKGLLSEPRRAVICVKKEEYMHITVEQATERTITVTAITDVSTQTLYSILIHMELLLMIFDGRFISLDELMFSNSDSLSENRLVAYSRHIKMRRLSYFDSSEFCKYAMNKLIDFDEIITSELFEKWEQLHSKLDIVHNMFLYSLGNNGITTDVKCAMLLEHAEPLIEIINEYKKLFPSLKPGDRGTTLKDCLNVLITTYGKEIFENELKSDFDTVLQIFVNSRVRIMHIKRAQRGMYLNGEQSILYSVKMYLLYRSVIFDLLGIDNVVYYDNLCRCVQKWDEWNDTLKKFLNDVLKTQSNNRDL